MITDLPTKRIRALSQWQTFLRVLPTRWRQKSTDIDVEQNYVTVTVTLCILVHISYSLQHECRILPPQGFLAIFSPTTENFWTEFYTLMQYRQTGLCCISAVSHLGFLKLKFVTAVHHRVKFCGDRSCCCRDIVKFLRNAFSSEM